MPQRLELVRHQRTLGTKQVDRWHGEKELDVELLVVLEKLREVKFGHPVDRPARDGWVDEVPLAAGDVCGG